MLPPFFKKKDPNEKPSELASKEQLAQRAEHDTEYSEEPQQEAAEDIPSMISSNKSHLDKKSLDLVFAVEQIIQARQHAELNNYELQDRLTHSNGHIERLT